MVEKAWRRKQLSPTNSSLNNRIETIMHANVVAFYGSYTNTHLSLSTKSPRLFTIAVETSLSSEGEVQTG